jgi:exopolyphosphatase/guanosine-5'-triphosphate,3'-diphosphate pyrophosphatase
VSEVVRIAAVDIGTVTTRLLVADVGSESMIEVARSTDITHLGEGLTATGRLSDAAIGRVVAVIERYVSTARELGAERTIAMATSASRDAANGGEFSDALAAVGLELSIIDGAREAELSFAGATHERSGEDLLVVDCGGGSTELVLGSVTSGGNGRSTHIEVARSVDIGSKRMTELFLASDPPTADELDAARSWAAEELRVYFDHLDSRPREMIAVAGTATSLAAIQLDLAVYDASRVHGFELSGSDLSELLEMLAALDLSSRRQVTGLHPDRAGVIVAGALILETVLALAGLDRMIVSEHDILYGILIDAFADLRESGR